MHDMSPRLKQLDDRLAALPEACDAMMLSELDGYLAGVLVCPEMILPSEWLPAIWSGDADDAGPPFDNAREMETLIGLVMQHYNAILRDLRRGEDRYGPIFDVDPRFDDVLWEFWIGGFERAMALRPESWLSIVKSGDEDAAAALAGLMTLVAIAGGENTEVPPEESQEHLAREAPDLIPVIVKTLHAWRLGKDSPAHHPTATARSAKVGRNDPCPCGSGKKFKKCCGGTVRPNLPTADMKGLRSGRPS